MRMGLGATTTETVTETVPDLLEKHLDGSRGPRSGV